MRVLDLFAGIGGFSLGLERAGMRTIQFVEIDPYCQRVLAKHWPSVPIHDDVRTFHAAVGFADVVCGGFPCQDTSVAGKRVGMAGARSGLWSEHCRVIGEVRPRYAIVENVAALLVWGLSDVLGDLASLGYDAEWHCIPASAVGAPHRRDRIWIVAYPGRERDHGRGGRCGRSPSAEPPSQPPRPSPHPVDVADTGRDSLRYDQQRTPRRWNDFSPSGQAESGNYGSPRSMADPDCRRLAGQRLEEHTAEQRASGDLADGRGARGPGNWTFVADTSRWRLAHGGTESEYFYARTRHTPRGRIWWTEPDVGRVAARVPARVDRLRCLGNSLVPQIAEMIGDYIIGGTLHG